MKRAGVLFLVVFAATLASAQITFGGGPGPERKEKPITSRTLTGTVMDKNDKPISEAIVYLKDTKTLAIKSFVSKDDGTYRFPALSMNIDYEIYAQKDQTKSPTKKLSQFDGSGTPRINLRIEGPG
ncbi:MAG TPA: carboxypeptidase-like regulatory domain-containing protein [Candidatus Koribacter sp.]